VDLGPLPTIEAEPLHMRQLFQNLLGNALKFKRPDVPPVVTVRAEAVKGGEDGATQDGTLRNWTRVTVSDNGIGFDPKFADRIFLVFQRLHSRAEFEGTGMGLAIARKIVEHHGGTIRASSRPGEGAMFIFTLPDKQAPHPP